VVRLQKSVREVHRLTCNYLLHPDMANRSRASTVREPLPTDSEQTAQPSWVQTALAAIMAHSDRGRGRHRPAQAPAPVVTGTAAGVYQTAGQVSVSPRTPKRNLNAPSPSRPRS
jgi:hypothetical protein